MLCGLNGFACVVMTSKKSFCRKKAGSCQSRRTEGPGQAFASFVGLLHLILSETRWEVRCVACLLLPPKISGMNSEMGDAGSC